jgi:hypothetical protein
MTACRRQSKSHDTTQDNKEQAKESQNKAGWHENMCTPTPRSDGGQDVGREELEVRLVGHESGRVPMGGLTILTAHAKEKRDRQKEREREVVIEYAKQFMMF